MDEGMEESKNSRIQEFKNNGHGGVASHSWILEFLDSRIING